MEKSSIMKEEIYKIVKYQTKLAQAETTEQQDLYKYKLSQHVKNLSNNGVSKREIKHILQGGSSPIQDLLDAQKAETLAAIAKLETLGSDNNKQMIQDAQEQIQNTATNAVNRHNSVMEQYKGDTEKALRSMEEVKNSAEIIANKGVKPLESLSKINEDLKKILDSVKGIDELASQLSEFGEKTKISKSNQEYELNQSPSEKTNQVSSKESKQVASKKSKQVASEEPKRGPNNPTQTPPGTGKSWKP